jgi:hypothetical protein
LVAIFGTITVEGEALCAGPDVVAARAGTAPEFDPHFVNPEAVAPRRSCG